MATMQRQSPHLDLQWTPCNDKRLGCEIIGIVVNDHTSRHARCCLLSSTDRLESNTPIELTTKDMADRELLAFIVKPTEYVDDERHDYQ